MKMKVYLAGYIQGSKLKECYEWRRRIREHYDHWKKPIYEIGKPNVVVSYTEEKYPIIWLDPLNGKDFATITPDGLKSSCPPHAIVHRDFNCVMNADLLIANMNTFGESRPMTGTICEMAWAWEHRKPIIMISKEKKYREHPFTSLFSSWIVESVDELLDKKCINYFYKGMASAEY
jgi:hypothetical protein